LYQKLVLKSANPSSSYDR